MSSTYIRTTKSVSDFQNDESPRFFFSALSTEELLRAIASTRTLIGSLETELSGRTSSTALTTNTEDFNDGTITCSLESFGTDSSSLRREGFIGFSLTKSTEDGSGQELPF